MSQQSNPATLRDLAIEWYRRATEGLAKKKLSAKAARQLRQCADELADLGAASGTEAAPEPDTSDIPEIKDWSKAVVGKFYRPRPAQAAASPEGEGRETPEEYKFNCKWKLVPSNRPVDGIDPDDVTKEFIYELPGETRVNGNAGAWYQSAVYWKHRALRQSAAPSRGVAFSDEKISAANETLRRYKAEICRDWRKKMLNLAKDVFEDRITCTLKEAIEIAFDYEINALAQESKTGAVKETK